MTFLGINQIILKFKKKTKQQWLYLISLDFDIFFYISFQTSPLILLHVYNSLMNKKKKKKHCVVSFYVHSLQSYLIDEHVIICSSFLNSSREIIRAMPLGKFLEEFFSMAETFNPLKLTDGEIGLFTSVLIICPGNNSTLTFLSLYCLH